MEWVRDEGLANLKRGVGGSGMYAREEVDDIYRLGRHSPSREGVSNTSLDR